MTYTPQTTPLVTPPDGPAGTKTSALTSATRVVDPAAWPGTRALTGSPLVSADLNYLPGQRRATWSFVLVNGVTGQRLGELAPIRQPATISHDVTRIIKRDLRIALTVADTAAVNPLTDRVIPYMHVGGVAYPLGRFMFSDPTVLTSTGGNPGMFVLVDETLLVDQQIPVGFTFDGAVDAAIRSLLAGLPITVLIDPTVYSAVGGWTAGSTRGQILGTLAEQGDYETPWMDNQGRFRMIRTVDPATAVPDLDFDSGQRVTVNSVGTTSDILTAPNRWVVVGNGAGSADQQIVGTYDLPPSAPNSATNRGFIIADVQTAQVDNPAQAAAIAKNRGLRAAAYTRAELETPPDPRHDSYQVIRWDGTNWVEVAWSVACEDGAPMRHTLRRNLNP